ncbi:hypothetical protein HG535_0D04780 [Zygotorulaspora mrakii]|uniref:HIT-type domain-containing protein n=1 Tax=Zygotorulaspora mrakii TaxID=42260 RepID=A0A7H9B472_ZYGMR|nr:uncharacterized protein HG535_0D04780 [Zygotorulaspora mrakii]QLG72769.1 hypothetical protein HG535_0D04780 [Zygotorulaspora mrakii]
MSERTKQSSTTGEMLVEEIDKRTYDPNVYFTSHDPASLSRSRSRVSKPNASSRSTKRINYSLADLENKLFNQQREPNNESSNPGHNDTNLNMLDKFTQKEVLQSKKRCLELDMENQKDIVEVPSLLSTITGVDRNKIEVSSGSNGTGVIRHKNKIEVPKNIHLSYRSTKPPVPKRKNTNRIVALKKTLSSRRTLQSYLETLDQVNRSIIYHNVSNKKFLKVLPVITICSVCGGYDSISSCVHCGSKICSLRCFNLHNETRCIHR